MIALRVGRSYDCSFNSGSPLGDVVGIFLFKKRMHPPLKQKITRTNTTKRPTVQTHTPNRMLEVRAYNEPAV